MGLDLVRERGSSKRGGSHMCCHVILSMKFTLQAGPPKTNYAPGVSKGAAGSGEEARFASGLCGETKTGRDTGAGGTGGCSLGDAAAGVQDPPEGVGVGIQSDPAEVAQAPAELWHPGR